MGGGWVFGSHPFRQGAQWVLLILTDGLREEDGSGVISRQVALEQLVVGRDRVAVQFNGDVLLQRAVKHTTDNLKQKTANSLNLCGFDSVMSKTSVIYIDSPNI